MAQITISDLHPIENEFAELSDLELESVVGGKSFSIGVSVTMLF